MNVTATYRNGAFHPDREMDLPEGTRVEIAFSSPGEPYSFFDTAMRLRVDGPPDWSENINEYLTGERDLDDPSTDG